MVLPLEVTHALQNLSPHGEQVLRGYIGELTQDAERWQLSHDKLFPLVRHLIQNSRIGPDERTHLMDAVERLRCQREVERVTGEMADSEWASRTSSCTNPPVAAPDAESRRGTL